MTHSDEGCRKDLSNSIQVKVVGYLSQRHTSQHINKSRTPSCKTSCASASHPQKTQSDEGCRKDLSNFLQVKGVGYLLLITVCTASHGEQSPHSQRHACRQPSCQLPKLCEVSRTDHTWRAIYQTCTSEPLLHCLIPGTAWTGVAAEHGLNKCFTCVHGTGSTSASLAYTAC